MSPRQVPLPLYQKVLLKYTSHRVLDIIILVLLLSLLLYRLLSLNNHGFLWLLAFLCESWFTFNWFLLVNMKWNPVRYITYPENLEKRFSELPPVDMFVTTADPVLEHPIITVNTVLSLLAVDYPANKLACYVSDDGCSPVTFYSLLQASRFAQLWVPFCKKYKIQVRAPFRYFLVKSPISNDNAEFQQEWIKMKGEYEQLREKIENAAKMSAPLDETGELAVFSGVERGNHPTIVKIIWENKEAISDGVPHLVYISREKRPKHHHRYKAGAMNVLTRVSGLMTNAPFLLNVDCDMFVNNPEVVRQAMCLLLGTNNERESAFIQFPQIFYDAPKDDPYGNQFVVLYKYGCPGITGIQGFFYAGTGCFHRRKVIYGLWPGDEDNSIIGNLSYNGLVKEYGNSKEFVESAVQALKGEKEFPNNLSNNLEAACQVADCSYEYGTNWGNKHGWMYGSVVEDVLTGLTIHNKGWKTIFVSPESPAFLGCAPSGGPAALTQQKRWATGLLESLVGRNSPILGFLTAKLLFRQCLAYVWVLSWSLASIPEICYAVLPAYCIITNSHFLPKVHEQAVYIPVAIFVLYNLYTLLEYIKTGLSFRAWWNNQRMARITAMTAYLFGILGVLLKFLGLSETVFEVTPKDQPTDDDDVSEANTEFTFDEMPLFVPGTALLLVQITAMFTILSGLRRPGSNENGVGPLEVLCSIWVILCFWPFLKGLFRKGKYRIPLSTIFKSAALALVFVNLCWTTTSAYTYSGRCPGPVE